MALRHDRPARSAHLLAVPFRSDESRIRRLRHAALVLAGSLMLAAGPVFAQGNAPAESTPEHPGRQVLASKCTQCHGDSMWRDIRQDETAWRATIYRMIGKGAVWSEAEVRAMSGYLASVMGPSASASATAPAAK